MAVSLKKARDFVYANGVLWERALFAWLFENGPLDRVHQCLLCYKNPDGGWGHAMEHDVRTPESHPLALEYLLTVSRDTGLPVADLLDGSVAWLEQQRQPDGSLKNPPSVLDYPHAPWWNDGGQTIPASLTGNLIRLGLCTPSLAASTRSWAIENLTPDHIRQNDWLFLAYHAYDYFMNVGDGFPEVGVHRQATINNILACTEAAPENQYYSLFHFAPTPDSVIAQAMPPNLLNRCLDYLAGSQQEDGGWLDQHGLPQWYPYVTILVLVVLRNFDRL